MAGVRIQGIYHSYNSGSFELEIESLEVADCQVMALVGESGCGKTTLLRAIAGLETPTRGTIYIDEEEVCGPSTFINPERRNIGLVFQDYALFPHLTVRKNLAFGLRKLSSSDRQKRIDEIVSLTHLEEYLDRYPHELSGGQQQRVALARALVCKPKVLLLDEPFSNMDEPLKVELRSEIKKLIGETKTTTILVSHDIRDAMAISDQIVILKSGQVEQQGTPGELIENPANDYVKQLISSVI
jgi:iron(III) transport system ATP-binding protein